MSSTSLQSSDIRVTKKLSDLEASNIHYSSMPLPTIQTIDDKRIWNKNLFYDISQDLSSMNAVNQLGD